MQLDLRCRQLKLIEVRALAEALRFDDSVTALCLASTGLSTDGCVAVARMLGYDGDGTPSVFGAEETEEWLEEFNLETSYNTNIRSAPAHLEHATCDTKHATCNMQHRTCDTQHTTRRLGHALPGCISASKKLSTAPLAAFALVPEGHPPCRPLGFLAPHDSLHSPVLACAVDCALGLLRAACVRA